jgi:hypothetical protein
MLSDLSGTDSLLKDGKLSHLHAAVYPEHLIESCRSEIFETNIKTIYVSIPKIKVVGFFSKPLYPSTNLDDVTSQKTVTFTVRVIITSNFTILMIISSI